MERLKRDFFEYHVDEPVIFHRKEMIKCKPPFHVLKNEQVRKRFDAALLKYLKSWDYRVFSVMIDQIEHKRKYITWLYDPYHYCLKVLLERYILWLKSISGVGDVLAESRGGKADIRLKDSYSRLYESGSEFIPREHFHGSLTSKELKVKPKVNNLSGLQLADLIAYPSYRYSRAIYEKKGLKDDFNKKIIAILKGGKYYISQNGKIEGYGIKLLS